MKVLEETYTSTEFMQISSNLRPVDVARSFSPSFVLRYAAAVFANAVRLLTSCSCVSST